MAVKPDRCGTMSGKDKRPPVLARSEALNKSGIAYEVVRRPAVLRFEAPRGCKA